MNNAELGSILKLRRETLKLRQEDLADYSGVGLKTIHSIEQGRTNPTFDVLSKIIDVLGLELILKMKEIK